jgi:hypothetical protein
MTAIPDAGSGHHTGAARAAVLAAVGAEHDFGVSLARVLATVTAYLGSTHALVARRPGSSEAEHDRGLVNGTVSSDDEYLEHYKTSLA